uniref:MYND-type domain-containing protein n=1 Tax=Haptolina ericina TaxID=156174 RepID=A0A7S3F438_9EUKA
MAAPEARAALRKQPLFFSLDEWVGLCNPSKVLLESSKEAVRAGVQAVGAEEGNAMPALDSSMIRKLDPVSRTPIEPSEALRGWKYCLGCQRSSQSMKRCAGCKAAYFCSTDCQQKAWKRAHKQLCPEWAARATLDAADHASIAAHHPLDGARVVTVLADPSAEATQIVFLPGDDPAYPCGLRLGMRML